MIELFCIAASTATLTITEDSYVFDYHEYTVEVAHDGYIDEHNTVSVRLEDGVAYVTSTLYPEKEITYDCK